MKSVLRLKFVSQAKMGHDRIKSMLQTINPRLKKQQLKQNHYFTRGFLE